MLCSAEINILKLPHAVRQSFQSIFPHILGGTMATCQTCCHLPGKMLNSAAKCADRARIAVWIFHRKHITKHRRRHAALLALTYSPGEQTLCNAEGGEG
jgi:hypothetical protein